MWGTRERRDGVLIHGRFIPTHVGNASQRTEHPCERTVHPHACGERPLISGAQTLNIGSSPRMWGTPLAAAEKRERERFIPTHVGNAPLLLPRPGRKAVHPHACGERLIPCSPTTWQTGSSPRMWGTPHVAGLVPGHARFIPTHVGNAVSKGGKITVTTVHPHACGERREEVIMLAYCNGSSPRMWGTQVRRGGGTVDRRFIPTHVGNAPFAGKIRGSRPVHPHACGERDRPARYDIPAHGSSPRMWGTPSLEALEHLVARFIPTHVGNAVHGAMWKMPAAVHPHACGERRHWAPKLFSGLGSSPRMWGTRDGPHPGAEDHRFIPTHVGNARSPSPCPGRSTVHPHACGERKTASPPRHPPYGSSPRMWGTQFRDDCI